ncbi:MAG: hypothetical protein JWM11_1679 [Planctomycetaceae bacterium]|nr:hypothetical protein [Planctomycetaceae bacterium]
MESVVAPAARAVIKCLEAIHHAVIMPWPTTTIRWTEDMIPEQRAVVAAVAERQLPGAMDTIQPMQIWGREYP